MKQRRDGNETQIGGQIEERNGERERERERERWRQIRKGWESGYPDGGSPFILKAMKEKTIAQSRLLGFS